MYGSHQTNVEVSPNVRKSAQLRKRQEDVWRFSPMYGSQQSQVQWKSAKLRERKVDVQGFPPGCTACSCARTRGERPVSDRVYLTLSDRFHLKVLYFGPLALVLWCFVLNPHRRAPYPNSQLELRDKLRMSSEADRKALVL